MMWRFSIVFFLSLSMVVMCHAQEKEGLQDLLTNLEDESFKVREQATQDLVAFDISINELRKLMGVTKNPELKSRLKSVITDKIAATGWIRMANNEIPKGAKPGGAEAIGGKELLYLVRTTINGSDYIGKYRPKDGLAHFPVGEKELIVNEIEIWVGKGKWQAWKKGAKGMIAMGKTKDGKRVYAARAKNRGGLHIGMLVEGETKARIPWGGAVVKLTDFEVMVME